MGLPTQPDLTAPKRVLNSTTTQVLKTGPGFVFSAGGAGAITLYDSADVTGGNTAANLIFLTTAASFTQINCAFYNGLLVTGAGPATVSFE